MSDGTTLCPHCDTRFRITAAQLEAHKGMARCGHCMQAFDARASFLPDEPDPQLELPILDQPETSAPDADLIEVKPEPLPPPSDIPDEEVDALLSAAGYLPPAPEPELESEAELEPAPEAAEPVVAVPPAGEAEHDTQDIFDIVADAQDETAPDAPAEESRNPEEDEPAMTLAEQVEVVHDEDDEESIPPSSRTWLWATGALLLFVMLLGQAAHAYRVELAARLPGLKPALVMLCEPLGCDIPLPRSTELMNIVSSELEADPQHANIIILNALLHNRAEYPQAFPSLELSLNDIEDRPLARRVFHPADYLPPLETEEAGLLASRELPVKLYLDVGDLKPTGYRLVLFYPQ